MLGSSPRPLVVVWRVTEACDLGCWFCEYNRRLRRPRSVSPAAEVLRFGRVLADYAAATGRPVLVSWLGGEPLVWPPLVEVGQRFSREFGLRLGLTTNGWQLDQPALLQHLAENYSEVTISVDGLAAAHDAGRGAPGLFEQLRASIRELRALRRKLGHGPKLRVNTILMRSNLRDFESLCAELAAGGIEELTFNALGGRPPGAHFLAERLLPADLAWLRAALPGLRLRLARQGLRLLGSERYLTHLADTAAGRAQPVVDCHPGASFLFVDELGRVSPCSFTSAGYGVPASQLQSAADLAQLPARLADQRLAAPLPACRDCRSPQVFGKFDLPEAA